MSNPYGNYLEDRVLSATPLELVGMLYDAALSAVQEAQGHLAQGRIAERSREITRAVAILTELGHSLDHEVGGDLSARLAALYDYMQRRLLDANFLQTGDGLVEVERLLTPLAEAWDDIARSNATVEVPVPVGAGPGAESAKEYLAHQWTA
jgi:flagellar secretion chaperone FliS